MLCYIVQDLERKHGPLLWTLDSPWAGDNLNVGLSCLSAWLSLWRSHRSPCHPRRRGKAVVWGLVIVAEGGVAQGLRIIADGEGVSGLLTSSSLSSLSSRKGCRAGPRHPRRSVTQPTQGLPASSSPSRGVSREACSLHCHERVIARASLLSLMGVSREAWSSSSMSRRSAC